MLDLLFLLLAFVAGFTAYHQLLKFHPGFLAWVLKTVKARGEKLEAQAKGIVKGGGGPGEE